MGYCWGKSSMVEGRFSKWFWSAKKGVLNLFLSISMAYNVISCQKVAENKNFEKSLNSLCKSGSRPQKSPKKAPKTDHSIAIYSIFLKGTRSYAALRAADLDWIVGPGYSSGGYILEKN